MYHVFTTNESSAPTVHIGRYSQVVIGAVGSVDFGGGTLDIQTLTEAGGLHSVRTIDAAAFAALTDKNLRLELPDAAQVVFELSSSTTPNLYVEHKNQRDS
jgi:hypothetical protein